MRAPAGIKWGTKTGIGRVDVPEEAKCHAFKWVVYGTKAAYCKGQYVNVVSIREAFFITFRQNYKYCNKCWYMFIGPHWVEMIEDIESFVLKEVRGPFYSAAILHVINRLEQTGGRFSEDEPPCNKDVWEHKKMPFKSNEIDLLFTKPTADFHEHFIWQQRLGSNRHVWALNADMSTIPGSFNSV
jgi:hypothetical protein